MSENFKLVSRKAAPLGSAADYLTPDALRAVRAFHESFPMYSPTPLAALPRTAKALGLGSIYVKDESYRLGLNAFKVLGSSWALACCIADRLVLDPAGLDFATLSGSEIRSRLGELCFITATDGNHGRGLAWAATAFGHRSVVCMPKGSAEIRLANIRAAGADAYITDFNYDDTVRHANRLAHKENRILVQDTSWPGYEEIPRRIMQGYGTMALEALDQLPEKPTHVFLQAGVGSMAGSVAGLLANYYGEDRPKIVIVEPNAADCFFRTAKADDGRLHFVSGDLNTMMAGLACGEPCPLAWDILSRCADHFVSCPDLAAATGMRLLARPVPGDDSVVSGESGAACIGCVAEIMTNPDLANLRTSLELNENSRLLFFSTEGATDPQNYNAIVGQGISSFSF